MVKRALSVRPRSSPVRAVDGVDFESIADSIPHMVWVAAPNGSTEYFNRWGTVFTGRPVEAHYGCGWLSLIYPDDADRARSEWSSLSRRRLGSTRSGGCAVPMGNTAGSPSAGLQSETRAEHDEVDGHLY